MRLPKEDLELCEEDYTMYDLDTEHLSILDGDSRDDNQHISCIPDSVLIRQSLYVNWESKEHCMYSIYMVCDQCQIDYEEIDTAIVRKAANVVDLNTLNEEDFLLMSAKHGSRLYEKMHEMIYTNNGTFPFNKSKMNLSEDVNKNFRDNEPVTVKRKAGRPRKTNKVRMKSDKKTGKVWEFLLRLLLEKGNEDMIAWEDRNQGMFKFMSSEKVAKLWGFLRGNSTMNYEKLSRAMRYYYKSKILLPVIGKRLVYKFGPIASGWKTKNEDEEETELEVEK